MVVPNIDANSEYNTFEYPFTSLVLKLPDNNWLEQNGQAELADRRNNAPLAQEYHVWTSSLDLYWAVMCRQVNSIMR